jgi:hypothetical protein
MSVLPLSKSSKEFLNTIEKKYKENKFIQKLIPPELKNEIIYISSQCARNHKENKIYPSCILLSISQNDKIRQALKILGIETVDTTTIKLDNRNRKELMKELRKHNISKGVKNFSLDELIILTAPIVLKDRISPIINFYENKCQINGRKNYLFNDITEKWTDYKLEISDDYIKWLFPDSRGSRPLTYLEQDIKMITNLSEASEVMRNTFNDKKISQCFECEINFRDKNGNAFRSPRPRDKILQLLLSRLNIISDKPKITQDITYSWNDKSFPKYQKRNIIRVTTTNSGKITSYIRKFKGNSHDYHINNNIIKIRSNIEKNIEGDPPPDFKNSYSRQRYRYEWKLLFEGIPFIIHKTDVKNLATNTFLYELEVEFPCDKIKKSTINNLISFSFPQLNLTSCGTIPFLTKSDIKKFKTNSSLRNKVIKSTLRMISLWGYNIKHDKIIKSKSFSRRYYGTVIGLLSPRNYTRITRMLKFLMKIDMKVIGLIVFLVVCTASRENNVLYKKLLENNWINTWTKILNLPYNSKTIKIAIKGLKYDNNSCYMDSVLVSLFMFPSKTIRNQILNKNISKFSKMKYLWTRCSDKIDVDINRRKNIQKEINRLIKNFRLYNNNSDTVTYLRKLFSLCRGTQPFHLTGTQDAGEFLLYLFGIFQVNTSITKRITYGRNSTNTSWTKVSEIIDRKSSPVIDITAIELLNIHPNFNITKLIKKTEISVLDKNNYWTPVKGSSYKYKKEVAKFITSPIVIFKIDRSYGTPIFNHEKKFSRMETIEIWKNVSIPEKFTLKDVILKLKSIVIHTGGAHYIALIKDKRNIWYHYNDIENGVITQIGSYDNMLKTRPNPSSHGTIFIYETCD